VASYLTRRKFLGGAVAAGAMPVAYAKAGPPKAGPRLPAAVDDTERPRLFLPAASGRPAGVRFANSPAWARNAPGWFLPSTVSAGCCFAGRP
jgi:hypothetical protein